MAISRWVLLYLQQQVPATALAAVRIVFGLLMLASCLRFIALGWIEQQYILPKIHFPYTGFEWVASLGSPGMYIIFGLMTVATVGMILGAWYRLSAIVFFLTFTYVELIDKTYYLNHYYFVSLVAFLLCLVPAHGAWSIDARRSAAQARTTVPRWTFDIFLFQLTVVYVYAGIAKINEAWLLDAMPLRIWMPAHDDLPVIGSLMSIPWMPWVFSWAGMLYDISVPWFLMHRRTRWIAYAAVVGFHMVTGMMFQIGVFPLVMIGMTLLFFIPAPVTVAPSTPTLRPVHAVIGLFIVLQLLIPWRFLLYPGNLYWTEEGYRFSWRVMLVEKAGTATFSVTDRRTGRTGIVDNRMFLNEHQEKQMSFQPDMILQFAHVLHDHFQRMGMTDPIVTADVWVTMNGESSTQLVDPTVDLSREQLGFHRNAWVLSYE